MLLTSADGASVELRPSRYEFPLAPSVAPDDDGWDANWLQIEGSVRTATGESWRFNDPSLTTWEAQELGQWLRAAAEGEVPVTAAPERDYVGVLEFTEPNLAFSIASREDDDLTVRVHLRLEAAPPPPWPGEHEQQRTLDSASVLTMVLRTTVTYLLAAAAAWEDDLAAFPHRTPDHRG